MEKLLDRLSSAFNLTYDLFNHLDEDALDKKLPDLPSNSIKGQLWCMVGARESYLKAIVHGAWQGFSCSLGDDYSKDHILAVLEKTAMDYKNLTDITSDQQIAWLFDILEHEIQHHGQLIRYVYGNHLTFPSSWNDRYTV